MESIQKKIQIKPIPLPASKTGEWQRRDSILRGSAIASIRPKKHNQIDVEKF